jgi:hypothetical protein
MASCLSLTRLPPASHAACVFVLHTGAQMRALPGVQAAAAAVWQSEALLEAVRLQTSLALVLSDAGNVPPANANANAAEALTQTAAHLLQWSAVAQVLCASTGHGCDDVGSDAVTTSLELLAWQLATRLGKGSQSSSSGSTSSDGCSSSSGISSRVSAAESVLTVAQGVHQHGISMTDFLEDLVHWRLSVLLVLVDSHLVALALAGAAAEPRAAAVAAAVGSGEQQQQQQQQLQLAARVSSTIQRMLQALGVSDLAVQELAAVRQQQLSAGALDSFGGSIPAPWATLSHPAAAQLCAFRSSVAGLKGGQGALNELLRQPGADVLLFHGGETGEGLRFLQQELREALPLLLSQVIAACGAAAEQLLPASILSDTADAVGSFCRLFCHTSFASWAAEAFPLVAFGSPGDSDSTAEVFDSLALVLLQCLRPLLAALDSSSSSSGAGAGGGFDAGAVAGQLQAADRVVDALQELLSVSLPLTAAVSFRLHESLMSVELALECVLRLAVQPWLLRHRGHEGIIAAACACFCSVTSCAGSLISKAAQLHCSQERPGYPAAAAAVVGSAGQLRPQQQQQQNHHARQVFCLLISCMKTAPACRFWMGQLGQQRQEDGCAGFVRVVMFAFGMAGLAAADAEAEGAAGIASAGRWLHLAGRGLLQLAQLLARSLQDLRPLQGSVGDAATAGCTCARSTGRSSARNSSSISRQGRRAQQPSSCCSFCAGLQDDLVSSVQAAAMAAAICCESIIALSKQAGLTDCTCQGVAAAEGQCTHRFVSAHKSASALVLPVARPALGGNGANLDQIFELRLQQLQLLVVKDQPAASGAAAGSSTGEQCCLAGWPAAHVLAAQQLQQVTGAAFDTLAAVTASFYVGSSAGPRRPRQSIRETLTAVLDSSTRAGAAVHGLQQQLVAVGEAWCAACPVPWCCNNPECDSVARVSEAALVGGKACVCGGCGVAR